MTKTTTVLGVAAPLALLALTACGRADSAGPERTSAGAGGAEVVAEVDGKPITRAELEERARERLVALRQQEYEILRQVLDELVAERLMDREAKARGISREELVHAEVDGKAPAPGKAEVDRIYEANRPRLGARTRDDVAPEIERLLRQRGLEGRREAFRRELLARAAVRVHLEPPRADVAVPPTAPAVGPRSAPVTIVEFTDYQCPYCRRAQPTVEQVLARYGDKVRLVLREFPLDNHPRAFAASRAARCAGEQGKFWDYHRDLLTNQADFSDQDFKRRAQALGLEPDRFASCYASDRHDDAIREAYEHGSRLGVTGTPTFFVNGRLLVGARPLEQFQQVIDEELAKGS
jgi:protein-disulfide isomerase